MIVFQVWYFNAEFGRDAVMGLDFLKEINRAPTQHSLHHTHVHLKNVEASKLEDIFEMMQGERWSPNGEAQALIRKKGLHHTSMSVGDVVVSAGGDKAWIADRAGFTKLWGGES